MKRNTQIILLTVLLLVFCVCLFAGCSSSEKADYFTYGVDNLGVVGKLVQSMHGWIGNYGWTVVVFTVFLKIAMLPLDLWQHVSSKKSTLKMQKLQPLLKEIDRRYGENTPRSNEEKQKLYKKQGAGGLSMCLPMIISMVVFFVMFGGLRTYSTYSSVTNFQNLSGTYFDAYYAAVKENCTQEEFEFLHNAISAELKEDVAEGSTVDKNNVSAFGAENFLRDNYTESNVNAYLDGITELCAHYKDTDFSACKTSALEKVAEYYETSHESWLWLQNVWQPDTWASIMPKYDDSSNGFSSTVNMSAFGDDEGRTHYDEIRAAVLKTGSRGDQGKWNGLMILPILSIALSFLSIFVSQKMDKRTKKGEKPVEENSQQATSNKMMMFMMPLLMAVFGFMYTGAFAIYMVCSYALSLLSTLALSVPVDRMVQKSLDKMEKEEKSNKASYMR